VTASNGCFATSTVAVTITVPPATPYAVASADTLIEGQTLAFTATGTASSWSWSGPNGFSSSLQNPSITNVTAAATGTYTVSAFNGTCPATAIVEVVVLSATQLVVSKSADNMSIASGETVNFTITVQNTGSVTALNVVLSEQLPAGLTYVSATAGTGSYNQNTGLWTIPSIPAGGTVTLTVQTTVQ
jgi:uncharacterized repeat protein (TIGR01451 family)